MRRRRRIDGERGFTLIEVLIALLVSVVGLAGVLILQANTVKMNRDSAQMNRATTMAEELLEQTRGMTVDTLTNGSVTWPTVVDSGFTRYYVNVDVQPISGQDNLVMITTRVSFDPEAGLSGTPNPNTTRTATHQMIRTKTEVF
jgi:prepilin-type N-terminal cleavage/methylation domain-containing protein